MEEEKKTQSEGIGDIAAGGGISLENSSDAFYCLSIIHFILEPTKISFTPFRVRSHLYTWLYAPLPNFSRI